MRVAFAGLSFLLAAPMYVHAHTSGSEAHVLEQCSGASQAGMRDCLMKREVESQRILSATEKRAAAAIAGWDEDERFIRAAQTRLTASTQAFEDYRQAQCALSAALGGGAVGGALELRRLSCVAAINETRIAQLRRMCETLPRR